VVSDPLPDWQPLADRESGIPRTEILHEGVPAHLEPFLRAWVYHGLLGGGAVMVALRLRIPIDPARDRSGGAETLANIPNADIELLNVIDTMLALDGPWPAPHPEDWTGEGGKQAVYRMRTQLHDFLDAGGSVYKVEITGRRIVRRTTATSAAALKAASAAARANPDAGSASAQIIAAWEAIHALDPDPAKAYREAVKAVESAAHAIIEPNNSKATLGTMLGQLRAHPARYQLAIPGPAGTRDITPLIPVLELL
jgi:hypothetical protein